jgi:UDP-glucuronate 4-epimerase
VHLAAQAGVRHSIENPHAYIDSNIVGFLHVIEGCRRTNVEHLVYASTSSVYGANTNMPFSVDQSVDHPLTLYAATKRANELMAHSYSNLYALPTTGLRFFTVYGPWGRPDMALFLFTKSILEDKPIDVFNFGRHKRDFTYVDDIVRGVVAAVDSVAKPNPAWDSKNPDPSTSLSPFRIYNIGNEHPVELLEYISVLEKCLNRTARKNFLPMQLGDVSESCADVSALTRDIGYKPSTPVTEGIAKFVEWYLAYYKVSPS